MPEVSVIHAGCTTRPQKKIFDIRGLPSRGNIWTHANDVGNVVVSVHERVLGRTSDGVWERTLQPEGGSFKTPGMARFSSRLKLSLGGHSLPVTTEAFLGHYRGQKRRRYEAAARSLETRSVRKQDSYPSVFIKAEKWLEDKPGRLISARSPRYNLEVGRYLLPAEPMVYRAIDGVWGSATIMKGYTPERRAAVIRDHFGSFSDPVAVGLDFSKFDQHISQAALAFEHAIYLGMYRGDAHLQKLLSWQLSTVCYANVKDGTVRYEVTGGRMSGDMNTAMGNCLLSAGLLWAYCWEQGITAKAVVDGDDSVAFMERKDLKRFLADIPSWMARRGFRLVMEEPVYHISEVEFCQSRYVAMAPPTMVRNPLKAITQDHTWIEDRSITMPEVLAATGLGGLSLYGHVPVLGAYYNMLARTTQPSSKTLARLDFRSSWLRDATMDGHYVEPSESSRYEFWASWGICPGMQRALEADFNATSLRSLDGIDTINKNTPRYKAGPEGNNYLYPK